MVSSKFCSGYKKKCIFKPDEYLYTDLSRLESPSHTECSVQGMHPGPDQSSDQRCSSVLCLYLSRGEGPFPQVKDGPGKREGEVLKSWALVYWWLLCKCKYANVRCIYNFWFPTLCLGCKSGNLWFSCDGFGKKKTINIKYLVRNDRLVLRLAVLISFIYVRAPKF